MFDDSVDNDDIEIDSECMFLIVALAISAWHNLKIIELHSLCENYSKLNSPHLYHQFQYYSENMFMYVR